MKILGIDIGGKRRRISKRMRDELIRDMRAVVADEMAQLTAEVRALLAKAEAQTSKGGEDLERSREALNRVFDGVGM